MPVRCTLQVHTITQRNAAGGRQCGVPWHTDQCSRLSKISEPDGPSCQPMLWPLSTRQWRSEQCYLHYLHTKNALLEYKEEKQVVKVIWQQAAKLPHMDSSMVFARLHQCAPHPIHASLGPSESKSQMASQLVEPFFAQLTAKSHYTLQWAVPFPP